MNNNKLQWLLMVLLIIAAFFLGSLTTKVKYLEQGVPTAGAQQGAQVKAKYKTLTEVLRDLAKKAKVDDKKLIACVDNGEKNALVEADTQQGSTLRVEGTPAFFINGRLIPGALPFDEFKKIIDEELSGKADPKIERKSVALLNSPVRGKTGAKVTIVEFSDFQCPFCQRAKVTMDQVLKEYADQVQLIYKHFPLSSIHQHAQKTAEAAECARDQGKFWEMHDVLFDTQNDWSPIQ